MNWTPHLLAFHESSESPILLFFLNMNDVGSYGYDRAAAAPPKVGFVLRKERNIHAHLNKFSWSQGKWKRCRNDNRVYCKRTRKKNHEPKHKLNFVSSNCILDRQTQQ